MKNLTDNCVDILKIISCVQGSLKKYDLERIYEHLSKRGSCECMDWMDGWIPLVATVRCVATLVPAEPKN